MARIVVIPFGEFGSVVEFCLHPMPMVDALALITIRTYRCTNPREGEKKKGGFKKEYPSSWDYSEHGLKIRVAETGDNGHKKQHIFALTQHRPLTALQRARQNQRFAKQPALNNGKSFSFSSKN